MTLEEELYADTGHRPASFHRRKKPEKTVQKAIAVWLMKQGAVVAITDAGILNRLGLGMGCGIPAGWPDITACLANGRFCGVECKAAKGRQSQDQLLMQERIEDNGGRYILAHSLDEFISEWMK
jgi:hypothetical protein